MRAPTVRPGTAGSAQLDEAPESDSGDGPVLVRTLAIGICGTDVEIVSGRYGCTVRLKMNGTTGRK